MEGEADLTILYGDNLLERPLCRSLCTTMSRGMADSVAQRWYSYPGVMKGGPCGNRESVEGW